MPNKSSNITISLPIAILDRLRETARQDRRSITSLILILVEAGLERFQPSWTKKED